MHSVIQLFGTRLRESVILALVICNVGAFAQELPGVENPLAPAEAAATAPASQPAPDYETLQKENAAALAQARTTLEAASAEQDTTAVKKEIEIRGNLDLIFAQIRAAEEHAKEHRVAMDARMQEIAALETRGLTEQPPYSFLLLQSANDELEAAKARKTALQDAITAATRALESARTELQQRETARRQAREAADTASEPGAAATRTMALRMAELESRLAQRRVTLRELELANLKLELEAYSADIAFLQKRRDLIAARVNFDRAALDEILANLDREEAALNQTLETVRIDLATRERRWAEVRQKLDAAASRTPALTEEVETRRLAKQTKNLEETVLGKRLNLITQARDIWQKRHQVFNRTVDNERLRTWLDEATATATQLESDGRLEASKLEERRNQATAVDRRILALEESATEVKQLLVAQKEALEAQANVLAESREALALQLQLVTRLKSEIGAQINTVTWTERLAAVWETTKKIWSYEITSLQDHPITVSKLVIGVILLVLGTVFSRVIARMIGTRLLPRFGLNEGAAAAIQSLLFYLLLLTVVMFSLRIVNVPLTAFTILGGALAIGVGFGSQAVMNNFISGLILLAERPIRVGDLVKVDEVLGAVAHIGPRSTRLRSPENIDYVVPNSFFLEKAVVNWTLYDERFRTVVKVGVAYGSPTREVAKLIRKAVEEHGKVLDAPGPIILFDDFGDNSLNFEVHFWVRMRRFMDRRIIESDIRFRIDALFREAGITIAFPQRDVHLDSLSPLQVQMLPPAVGEVAGEEDAAK